MKLAIFLLAIGVTGATINIYAYVIGQIHMFGTEWLIAAPCLYFGTRRLLRWANARKQ